MYKPDNDIDLEDAILRTLSYFDIFNYPLKANEVLMFLSVSATISHVQRVLDDLAKQKQVYQSGDFFSLQFNEAIIERRKKGNALADSLFPDIQRKANLIYRFPFVRGVMASGSFSKNYMDEKSDFDFFIVCAPKRIWISRMLLVLYKKLLLNNSHKHFCVNYFVDESHLEIDEKNVFTATELATVLPLNGFDQYISVMKKNHAWMQSYFPNFTSRIGEELAASNSSWIKNVSEAIINVFFGNLLNKLFQRITLNRWRKTYRHLYAQQDFDIAFKSTDGVSKNHPQNFQKRVIEKYNARISSLPRKIVAA